MLGSYLYTVSWARGPGAGESRKIADENEAIGLYEGLIADPKVDSVRVVETVERDIRFFEREARRGHDRPASVAAEITG